MIVSKEEYEGNRRWRLYEVEWRGIYRTDKVVKNLAENVLYLTDDIKDHSAMYFTVFKDGAYYMSLVDDINDINGDYNSDREQQFSRYVREIGPLAALEFMEL